MEKFKKNILVLGIGQSNFLNSLYGEILKRSDSFNFHIDVLNHIAKDTHNQEVTVFSEGLNFGKYVNNLTKLQKRLIFFKAIKISFYRQIFFFELSQKKSIKKALKICQRLALKEYVYHKHIKPKNFDVLHFHFCTKANLEYLHFIGNETKVICSFWGSDLFRVSDIISNFYVSKALNNADIITVQSPEMTLTLKAKYGVHLSEKIKDLRFTISTETYNFIDLYRDDLKVLTEFSVRYKLDNGRINVAIGHNAFKENNHLKIIQALKSLPQEYKNKFNFILHLGYGGNHEYIDVLKSIVQNTSTLNFVLIEDFLNPSNVAKLRLISNIMIHAPISDALSGTVTEVLYAGNKVISGGWLPFGILRRNKIHFEEFNRFEEIPLKLINYLDGITNNVNILIDNKNSIKNFMFPEKTSKEWIKLFDNLLNE